MYRKMFILLNQGSKTYVNNVYYKLTINDMSKRNKEVIFDFGEWKIADKWEDVSLRQFTELMKLNDNGIKDVRDVIAILSDHTKDEINLLPIDFIESMMARLTFLNKAPEVNNSNEIKIDGEVYFVNVMEKLKTGEFIDVNSAIQSDSLNYAAFLAILCRKKGELYNDDFVANHLDERIEMYNNQPITKILPVIGFFLNLWRISKAPSQNCMTEIQQTANQLLKDTETSLRSGGYKKLSLKHLMKVWWNIRKYKKCMRQLF